MNPTRLFIGSFFLHKFSNGLSLMSISNFRSLASRLLPAILGIATLGLSSPAARADYVTSDSRLPSPSYRSTESVGDSTASETVQVHSLFDLSAELDQVPSPVSGDTHVESLFGTFTETSLELSGSPVGLRESQTRQALMASALGGLPPSEPVYSTEMLPLPTLQSTGQAHVEDFGFGLQKITELSIEGRQPPAPASDLGVFSFAGLAGR